MTIDQIIARSGQLPAAQIADSVNTALDTHGNLVITAPPGAGKSTLLPLTIMAGRRSGEKILVLEPRRLAARQIAERMAEILGERTGRTVGYRVRFEHAVSDATRIEVITEGILTRMLVADPTMEGVGTLIFDEFHERSIHSDLALALARQVREILRPDLRIVVMSATIDTEYICRTLHAPLIESKGRMFPVHIVHAERDTPPTEIPQAVAAAICRAHREQEGDILAFLPGQGEIERCADLLGTGLAPTRICPLYGNLSPDRQRLAIAPSQEGERKVVLATPIAETSITIEGVRTVIDSGLCRSMVFDARTGLSHLETIPISKDMARQRTGRAGRVAEGICYRLWTIGTQHHMSECRQPEIAYADLAPLVLEVTAFGESDIGALPWLTPPSEGKVAQARQLLQWLGAIDRQHRLTPLGRRMSELPCHPRISRMILCAETPRMQSLACDIAAILEEKDPLGEEAGIDMTLRIDALRTARRRHDLRRWHRIAQVALSYRRMVHAGEDNGEVAAEEVGRLIACAYPERIAQSADGMGRTFRLAGGGQVQTESHEELSACPWLAIASLHAAGNTGRIFLAAPLHPEDVETQCTDRIFWDSRQGCIVAQRERRIGQLTVESRPLHDIDQELVSKTICSAVQKDGRSMFDWNDEVLRLQLRVAKAAEWHPELSIPDISTDHLLQTAEEWLPPVLLHDGRLRTTAAEMRRINLCPVLWSLIPYDLQQQIERIAPSHIVVPTGSRIRVDYRQGAEAPILSVRLQECFGLTGTPRVDDGRRPVLMELLSPGFKPVQLTQDLRSFWDGTYFDVRKELRRRYPKHCWPENPLEAAPVRGVKKKKQ